MIYRPPPFDPDAPVVVIDIGNSAIKIGTWHAGELKTPVSTPTGDHDAFVEACAAHAEAAPFGQPAAIVIASVVPEALERIKTHVVASTNRDALVVGEIVGLPMDLSVRDSRGIGVDRVCAAAAAYDTLQTGCTVISFGTAVTVDLVNDEGVFVGGAILPGVRLQLLALHEHTAVLPLVESAVPENPYGRDTVEAIQTGVCRGITGSARTLVEGYATHLGHWPQVVATGGDAPLLFPHCDFIDTVVRDLALRGVGIAYTRHLAELGA